MRAQVALELTEALLAVREEDKLLVVLEVLASEDLGQVPPWLGIMAQDKAEALGGTVRWNRLAHDRDEVGLPVLPVPQVATVDAHRDRLRGCRQAGTLTRTAGQRKARLGAEFGLQTAGHPQRLATNGRCVQPGVQRQEVLQGFDGQAVRNQ